MLTILYSEVILWNDMITIYRYLDLSWMQLNSLSSIEQITQVSRIYTLGIVDVYTNLIAFHYMLDEYSISNININLMVALQKKIDRTKC